MIQTFVLPVPPTAKGRPRFAIRNRGIPMAYTPGKTVDAEERIRWHLHEQGARLIPEGIPIRLSLIFKVDKPKSAPKSRLFPTTRPDLDNYCKLVQDACNGLLWHDDSQIVQLTCSKVYAIGASPEIVIAVHEAY